MTPEEQLSELKEEVRNLKTLMAQLLAEDRLEKILIKQLRGFKAYIRSEIAQLQELLLEEKMGSTQMNKSETAVLNFDEDRKNRFDQTLIIDRQPERIVFFAGLPVNGVFFANKILNEFIARKTLYQIIHERLGADTAVLDLVTDVDTLTMAFNLPDTYLGACELRGIGELSYGKMKYHEPGKVQLEGPNWVITQKIIIYFGE